MADLANYEPKCVTAAVDRLLEVTSREATTEVLRDLYLRGIRLGFDVGFELHRKSGGIGEGSDA